MSIPSMINHSTGLKKPILYFTAKLLLYSVMIYFGFTEELFSINTSLIQGLLYATTFFLSFNLVVSLARLIVISLYLRKHRDKKLDMNNFVLGINRISSIINTCTFMISIMIFFDIDIRNMFVSLSIAAAAIAVLSKDYIASMTNGLIIMFSDRLSLGDKIIIGEFSGKIRDITLINIIIENQEGDVALIPNSVVSSSIVLNRSKKEIRQVVVEFELRLDHLFSVGEVEKTLKSTLTPFITDFKENSFSLQVVSMKQNLINCKAQLALIGRNKVAEHQIHRAIQDAIIALVTTQSNPSPKD